MRLTLRTLLAYLDDVLEPAQVEELRVKIRESPMASELESRIKEATRRRRLTSPPVSGVGVGLDANEVAEYLDNALPPEGVAHVEKVCLESDVHLAEVAACHQILTLVLGEPVEVPPNVRDRMYALINSAAATPRPAAPPPTPTGPSLADIVAAAPAAPPPSKPAAPPAPSPAAVVAPPPKPAPVAAPAAPAPAASARPTAEPAASFEDSIPDYLRPKPFRSKFWLTALAVLIGGVWVGAMYYDHFLKLVQAPPADRPVVADAGPPPDAEGELAPDEPETEPSEMLPEPEVAATTPTEPIVPPALDPAPPPDAEEDPVVAPTPPAVAVVPTTPPQKPEPPAETPAPTPPPATAGVGPTAQYKSSEGILLRFEPDQAAWFVMPKRAIVHPGDLVVSPEPFEAILEVTGRPEVVSLLPGTEAQYRGEAGGELAELGLRRGRALIRAKAGEADGAAGVVGLSLHGTLWTVQLATADAACGLEVRILPPREFENTPEPAWVGQVSAQGGSIRLTDPAGTVHELGAGESTLIGPEGIATDADPRSLGLDRTPREAKPATNYAKLFEKEFAFDDPVADGLKATLRDKRPEMGRLAAACLALIHDYDGMLQSLDRCEHEEARIAAIEGLRTWLVMAPENREVLKMELARHFFANETADVYRLLWGFNEDDARNREMSEKIVDLLAHERLALRELAFYQVFQLTGRRHEYRPNAAPVQRASAVNLWRKQVDRDGGLLPPAKSSSALPRRYR